MKTESLKKALSFGADDAAFRNTRRDEEKNRDQ